MKSQGKSKMGTIKVSQEAAAILSNVVRRLKAQGAKGMTVNKLILQMVSEKYPRDTELILNDERRTGENFPHNN